MHIVTFKIFSQSQQTRRDLNKTKAIYESNRMAKWTLGAKTIALLLT